MATQAGSAFYNFDVDLQKGIANLDKIDGAVDSTNKGLKRLETQTTKTAKSVNGALTQNIQNASFQFQDFFIQIAGGQSALVALTQQLPQLLGGIGLLGAGIATAVAVFGGLYQILGDTTSNIEKLEQAIENVKAVLTVGSQGVENYTNEMKELARVSETLARTRLAQAIVDSEKQISLSAASIQDSFNEFIGGSRQGLLFFRRDVELFAQNVEGDMSRVADALSGRGLLARESDLLNTIQRLQRDFDITREQAISLGLAFSDIATRQDALSIQAFSVALEDIAEESGFSNTKINELLSSVSGLVTGATSATKIVNQLRVAIQGNTEEIINNTDSNDALNNKLKSLRQSLLLQREELENGRRAAFALSLSMDGLSESEINATLALYDANEAIRQQKENAEASAQAIDNASAALDRFFELEESRDQQRGANQNLRLDRQVENIGLTPLEQIQSRYDQELALLMEHKEKINDVNIDYAAREEELERRKQQAINATRVNGFELFNQQIGFTNDQIADTFTDLITGAKSGSEALRGLARTILTSVIKAIIQQGVASATASATAATAQNTANVSVAATAAPAAALTSLASFGANSIPALAGLAAVTAAALAIPKLAGARRFGGPVSGGKPYLVGEDGPEVVVPSGNAKVISNKDSFGGMGDVQVNVYGVPSSLGQPDVAVINKQIDIRFNAMFSDLSNGKGGISKAMRQGTNARFNSNR